MDLWQELLQRGGWVMVPLLIISLLTWYIVIEKFLGLFFLARDVKKIRGFLSSAKNLDFIEFFVGKKLYLPLKKIAALKSENFDEVSELTRGLHRELAGHLWLLATFGPLSPFIGLLGTVLGIMTAFDAMAQSGESGFSVVAQGLSEALFATAAGILVAIIAVFWHNFFRNSLRKTGLKLYETFKQVHLAGLK